MGNATVRQIFFTVFTVLVITLAVGQGCSGLKGPAVITDSLAGNGGGYGGMVSGDTGAYSGFVPPTESGTSPGPSASPYFYLVGVHTGCTDYPANMESIGPDIIGAISYGNSAYYAPSLCDTYSPITSTLSIVDFDPNVAIYNNAIYRHFADTPPTVSELVTPVAYCQVVSTDASGVEVGTDVSVYTSGSQLFGAITEGKDVNGQATQFTVQPFQLSQTITASQISYSTGSFQLTVVRNGNLASTGTLALILDGQSVSLAMNCWLTTP